MTWKTFLVNVKYEDQEVQSPGGLQRFWKKKYLKKVYQTLNKRKIYPYMSAKTAFVS